VPPFVRADGVISYGRKFWKMQFNLKNLNNDRFYETDGIYGLLLPAAPRRAEVAMRFQF
jgi:hypothetical protein